MQNKFHGVCSLILILSAVLIALIYLLSQSPVLGLAYLGIMILANPIVLYAYCAKCLCRDDACSHVFPGKLTRLLPSRKQGPYTRMDYFWTSLSLIALFGFPVAWLWQNRLLFFGYWILLGVGLAEILLFVCRTCRNENCLMCSASERKTPVNGN